MAIRQQYALDLVPNRMWVHVPCSQYDKQSRIIEFLIYNDNNDFEIPTGAMVYVHGTKKDGTGFEYQCSFSGNVVQMVIEEQMTVFHGKVLCELRIAQGDQILGTSNFYLDVEISPLNDETVISETELPLLQEAIDASVSALQSAQSAQQSAQTVSALIPSNVGTDDQFLAKDGNGAIWKDAVSSFNGRKGDVMPVANDYSAEYISYAKSGTQTNVQNSLDEIYSLITNITPIYNTKTLPDKNAPNGVTKLDEVTLDTGLYLCFMTLTFTSSGGTYAFGISKNDIFGEVNTYERMLYQSGSSKPTIVFPVNVTSQTRFNILFQNSTTTQTNVSYGRFIYVKIK